MHFAVACVIVPLKVAEDTDLDRIDEAPAEGAAVVVFVDLGLQLVAGDSQPISATEFVASVPAYKHSFAADSVFVPAWLVETDTYW